MATSAMMGGSMTEEQASAAPIPAAERTGSAEILGRAADGRQPQQAREQPRRGGRLRRASGLDGQQRAARAEIRPPTGRIQLWKGRIWPEEPAAAAMAEEVGRGRDWRRADGDEEAATGEDEGAATPTAAAE